MKSELNTKMLRIAVVEVLLQLGFEKCTEQSLNIVTEIFNHYLEFLVRSIHPIQQCSFRIIAEKLFDEAYSSSEYEKTELDKFLDQQNGILRLIQGRGSDKDNNPGSGSLLHLLRLLPAGQSLKSIYKTTKTLHFEEEKFSSSGNIQTELELDAFLQTFIEHCESKFRNKSELKHHQYKCNYDKDNEAQENTVTPSEGVSEDCKLNLSNDVDNIYDYNLGQIINSSGPSQDIEYISMSEQLAPEGSEEEQQFFLDEFQPEKYKIHKLVRE